MDINKNRIQEELFIKYITTNDESVFSELFKQVDSWLFVAVYGLTGNRNEADDIIQEAWIKVIENHKLFDPKRGKFSNYIYTISKNLALQKIRSKKVKSKYLYDIETMYENTTDDFETNELGQILRESIKKIKNKSYQDALILYYFGELNLKEVAKIMCTTDSNILNWLKRGRKQLEQELRINPEYENFYIPIPKIIYIILILLGVF